ncbi:MAG: hypothetical protein QOH39_2275 [Verrucomicrobiota bacterium]|jgi:hypothetical protein
MIRIAGILLLFFAASSGLVLGGDSNLKSEEVYQGWLQMYDLKFDQAHAAFDRWQQDHPDDPLGPASNAAGYLFSELARLGVLESELFVDDTRFKNRKTLDPDVQVRASFLKRIDQADGLADSVLQKSSADPRALFVKTLTHGLRADYVALINGQGFKALSYTKSGRVYADRLLVADPEAFDAYLGPGLENYLLSLKPVALRILLRLTGSQIDRDKGLEQLRKTAAKGYYLEPFAKLLLGVAALRDNDPAKAREILTDLHARFPNNELYSVELNRLVAAKP